MNDYSHTVTINRKSSAEEREIALRQIYLQVLERQPYAWERKLLQKEERDFLSGKLGVRHFLQALGCSAVYLDSFYYNSSNLKFVENCLKHFLGRAPADMAEVEHYSNLLMTHGVTRTISDILGSDEYRATFGCFTVPYARQMQFYPSARNYLQSQLLSHEHPGQRGRIVPTMFWQQLGLNCESGVCQHPEVDGAFRLADPAPASKALQEESKSLDEEIDELIAMLQRERNVRSALEQLTPKQRSLLRTLAARKTS